MHVAILARGLGGPGAVALVALRQARGLARFARVTLISDSFPPSVDFAACVPVKMPNLDALRRFRHVFDEIAFCRRARRALGDVDFVISHSHALAVLARPRRDVPMGLVVHADIRDRPVGSYDARQTAFYRWVTPRAYRAADVVFALAEPFAELARAAGAKRIAMIHNGVDLADLGLAPPIAPVAREPNEPLRVLYAGRLAVEKGIDDLIAAMEHVPEATLTIAGSGPHRPPTTKHQLLGAVPRQQLGSLFRAHHVVCVPSISEPFGLFALEALASGVPVIATRVGGLPRFVHERVNGLLVPPRDPRALAEAIALLARDEPLRATLAANAHASVLPRFAWEEVGETLWREIQSSA